MVELVKDDQKEIDSLNTQIKDLVDARSKTLKRYGHLPSNIPIHDGYWNMGNQIHDLQEQLKYAVANLAEDKSAEKASEPEVKTKK